MSGVLVLRSTLFPSKAVPAVHVAAYHHLLLFPQVAALPKPSNAEESGTPLAATTPSVESTTIMSGFAQSRLLALERASSSTRTYALEKLGDYRTHRLAGKGIGDTWGSGGVVADPIDYSFGDKNTRDAATLAEVGGPAANGYRARS